MKERIAALSGIALFGSLCPGALMFQYVNADQSRCCGAGTVGAAMGDLLMYGCPTFFVCLALGITAVSLAAVNAGRERRRIWCLVLSVSLLVGGVTPIVLIFTGAALRMGFPLPVVVALADLPPVVALAYALPPLREEAAP